MAMADDCTVPVPLPLEHPPTYIPRLGSDTVPCLPSIPPPRPGRSEGFHALRGSSCCPAARVQFWSKANDSLLGYYWYVQNAAAVHPLGPSIRLSVSLCHARPQTATSQSAFRQRGFDMP
ncbi:hypothetical protein CIB48_g9711 [Xylaria polymorpha]|nr:hypothetical protein CIB48_g9711 [Xylaria polymorpha]